MVGSRRGQAAARAPSPAVDGFPSLAAPGNGAPATECCDRPTTGRRRGEPTAAVGRVRRAGLRSGAHVGRRAGGCRRCAARSGASGVARRVGRGPGARPPRQRLSAHPAYPRPVRQPRGRGRVPPVVALADAHRGGLRPARHAVDRRGGLRRARRAGRGVLPDGPAGVRPLLPDLDDLRGGARAAPRRRDRRGLRAGAALHDLRVRPRGARHQARSAGRDVDDREAGWLRRAREYHASRTVRGRHLPDRRPQVVHLGPDERPLPHPRPGAGWAHLLRAPACAARRHAQRHPADAAEGQAGQPVERLG